MLECFLRSRYVTAKITILKELPPSSIYLGLQPLLKLSIKHIERKYHKTMPAKMQENIKMKINQKEFSWSAEDIRFDARNYGTKSTTQPVTKRVVDGTSEEFYPTPAWATLSLLDYENFTGEIWECACGDGAMSKILEERGHKVYSSDKFERGFGAHGIDFLTEERTSDNIITNPPYNLAGDFVLQGLQKSHHKLALLLRLAFLEGGERYRRIFASTPPSRIWVFSERITFYPKGAERKGSGTTAYAWLVWDKKSDDRGRLGWISPGHKSAT